MPRLVPLFALTFVALLAGCASPRIVTVDGYASPAAKRGGSYFLTSGNIRIPDTDLQFADYAERVHATLTAAGWTRATDRASADTLIRFAWTVSEPITEVRDYDTPEFGTTGYNLTRSETTDASGKTVTHSHMTPMYGHTGYTRRTDVRISHALTIRLDAYSLRQNGADGNPLPLWKTLVATRDAKGDLRGALTPMLRTAAPHIATDTAGLREIELKP